MGFTGSRIQNLNAIRCEAPGSPKAGRRPGVQSAGSDLSVADRDRAGPRNFRRQWREARGEELAWAKPSSFRKAVATLIDREAGSLVASRQLGHSSDAVTLRHYIERNRATPDTTSIRARFR